MQTYVIVVSVKSGVPRRQIRTKEPLVQMPFRMPSDLHKDLVKAADDADLTRTAWMVSIIARHLNHPEYDQLKSAQE